MSPFTTTMRRFSRSSSQRGNKSNNNNNPQSPPNSYSTAPNQGHERGSSINSNDGNNTAVSSAASSIHHSHTGPTSGPIGSNNMGPQPLNGTANDSRPISSQTDSSFDFSGRPIASHPPMPYSQMPISSSHSVVGNLSRTDQIVLRHFWETKFQENCKRDLHYLKFPHFPPTPSHKDLLPYCEIYHLVKTSPGASIISLGSANGVYIGFELQTGSQLHIDMDDEWHNISHYRVQFKSYDAMVRDPQSDVFFKTWPKPLTIEFLEEQYQKWCLDLMSICWEGKEVRELGGTGMGGGGPMSPSPGGQSNGGLANHRNGNGVKSPIGGEAKRGFSYTDK